MPSATAERLSGTELKAPQQCGKLVALLALSGLAIFTSEVLAQTAETSAPVVSSGLHEATEADLKLERHSQPRSELTKLPPLEIIDAGSDILPFLGSGVPEDLTRAALRRAWSADPAIRDFVGLSENSWDFNAPGSQAADTSPTPDPDRQALISADRK